MEYSIVLLPFGFAAVCIGIAALMPQNKLLGKCIHWLGMTSLIVAGIVAFLGY